MTSRAPLLTLGMPVFNGERYIREAVDSLLAQSCGDFELVISDNASTDATEEICREYQRLDQRVQYYRQRQNLGAAANHNFVYERARGHYFHWAAYDDVCASEFLAACTNALQGAGAETVLAYPKAQFIDDDGNVLADDTSSVLCDGETPADRLAALVLTNRRETILHWCLPIYGVFRYETLAKTQLIGRYNKSDTILLVEAALHGKFVEVPDVLFFNRKHAGSSQVANQTKNEIADWFDPRASHDLTPMVRSRLYAGYVVAVGRTPMPTKQRLACMAVLARKLRFDREWRHIGGEWKIRMRELKARLRHAS